MLLKSKYDVAYFLSVALAIFVAALAATEFVLTAKYSPYLSLDSYLKKNASVSSRALQDYASRLPARPETCRSDILNATVGVAMGDVEQKMFLNDRRPWLEALRSMEPLLRESLACMPTDGMLWARLATVRWLLGGSADEQALLMNTSQAYAPAEIQVLRSRFVQWQRVSPQVISLAEHALRADIHVVLNYASPRFVKEILGRISPQVQPLLLDEMRSVSQARQDELSAEGVILPDAPQ